ncbi:MAG TPA: TolC family protein, partial [Thermoanaerobaculia bacterium]|nr:TolC family protein [Thermoanaerobaculia bacterium]
MRNAISILCLVALAGCSLMPDYQRPDAPVPASLPGPAGDGAVAAELGWQEFLVDEHLRAVVEQALANNRDLRIAALNVEKVAALVRLQRSELSPGFGAQAAGERRRIP